jgi:hypothetical protein
MSCGFLAVLANASIVLHPANRGIPSLQAVVGSRSDSHLDVLQLKAGKFRTGYRDKS